MILSLGLVPLSAVAQGIGDTTFPALGDTGYQVSHYLLKLNYDPGTRQLKSDVTMSATAGKALRSFEVDFSGFTISKLSVNGETATYDRKGEKLVVTPSAPLPAGQPFEMETAYTGTPAPMPTTALPGISVGWFPYKDGAVVLAEPDQAHSWFPCNDHPLEKATFEFRITTPNGYRAVANGLQQNRFPTDSGPAVWIEDKPMQTCMAVVAIGHWQELDQKAIGGILIRNFFPAGDKERYEASLLKNGVYLEFLSQKLGPYPWDSYGTISLPNVAAEDSPLIKGAALETVSIPVFGPGLANSPEVLVHEMCHQWMGDCVSVTNWGDDIWWVEGFATYSEHLWLENEKGHDAYLADMKDLYDRVANAPWVAPGHLTAGQMFSGASYEAGCLLFYALREKIGDDAFYEVVHRFIHRHSYRSASAADWIAIASEVTQKDMKPFFNAWLYGDHIPNLAN